VALAENAREMIMPDGTTKTIRKAYPVLAAQFNGLTVNDDFGFFNPVGQDSHHHRDPATYEG
jgi:hypothetical protein